LQDGVDDAGVGGGPGDGAIGGDEAEEIDGRAIGRERGEGLQVGVVEFLLKLLSGGERKGLGGDGLGRVLDADGRSAEAPAGPGGHIDAHAEFMRFGDGVAEHLHPVGAEVVDVFRLGADGTVNRDDVDATPTGIVVAGEFLEDVLLVHGAAHPPPEAPGAGGFGGLGPCEGIRGGRGLGRRFGLATQSREKNEGEDKGWTKERAISHGLEPVTEPGR